MQETASLTPMFRQYRELKRSHAGTILLFRMGDFYEMFFEDAEEASRLLDLTLTARGKGTASVAAMCGFPHHQVDAYTAKLVRAGRRVAICDQVEDPRTARGLVRREVVRVVTPGSLTDPEQLDARENSWAAAVAPSAGAIGAAFLDVSTGAFLAWQSPGAGEAWEALGERLASFEPQEIVVPEGFEWPDAVRRLGEPAAVLTPLEPWTFDATDAESRLRRHFQVDTLDGFGLRDRPAAVAAAGALLHYLQDTQRAALEHIASITLHEPSCHLMLDPATRRNLEIERSQRDGGRRGSLIEALDRTVTSPGARLFRSWILAPLRDGTEIARRHDAVEELLSRTALRMDLRRHLDGMHDVERLCGRAAAGTATARDLVALRSAVQKLPALKESLGEARSALLVATDAGLDPCADVAARLEAALVDEPPISLREGGLLKDGFHPELDELRAIRRDGRAYIAAIESRERERTGIASLKVRYNRVFGYYIEVSRSNLHLVPAEYERKQTVANAERFVTAEIKELEAKVLDAQDRIEALELEAFVALRSEVARDAPRLTAAARASALVDVVSSYADAAAHLGFSRPRLSDGLELRIVAGRHPVVEGNLREGRFTPNDLTLEPPGAALAILTGPNMGGKSTYLRQTALIAILAQAGSFVPAEGAEVGLVDRIFCRVGASDSLAEGQSTFMVEMTETANILHHATPRSLVLLDEIGRGTSTFDGLAIAWAVVEHLQGRRDGSPRTLFATHYHELTELAVALPGVLNLRMAVREHGDRVVFTHRVESGAADRSYGIHVARLAGVPSGVLDRAREILDNLERDEFGGDGLPRRARRGRRTAAAPPGQTPLFPPYPAHAPAAETPDPAVAEVLAELRSQDPDRITPLEALERLHAWSARLRRSAAAGDRDDRTPDA